MAYLSTRAHGVLDYLSAGTLLLLPRALGWSPGTTRLLTGAALGTLTYSLLTRYELSLLRLLPMETHLKLDGGSGLLLATAPLVLGRGSEKAALLGLGLFEIGAALATERDAEAAPGSGPLAPVAERVGITGPTAASGIRFERAVTIDRSADELYEQWRTFEKLPHFMSHLKSVTSSGEKRSHWVYGPPVGPTLEWDAETTADIPSERIAWRSLAGSPIQHSGTVRFKGAPGGRGTEVHVRMAIQPPGGVLGEAIGSFFEEVTAETLQSDLRNFKQMMEAGEIATVEGQPSGPVTGVFS